MTIKRRKKINSSDKEPSTQELVFIINYLKHYNGYKAAVEAGYSEKSAYTQASLMLDRPHIRKAIEKYEKHVANSLVPDVKRVLKELSVVANSDIADYIYMVDGRTYIKNLDELPPQASRAIKKIRGIRKVSHIKPTTEKKDKKGNVIEPSVTENVIEDLIEVELWDKMAANKLIGTHLKMFTEKVELTGADGNPLFDGIEINWVKPKEVDE